MPFQKYIWPATAVICTLIIGISIFLACWSLRYSEPRYRYYTLTGVTGKTEALHRVDTGTGATKNLAYGAQVFYPPSAD